MNASVTIDEKPKGHPKGLWVLVITETFERMSFYGTRPLLMLYMTASAAMGGLGLDLGRATAIFAGYYLSLYVFALSGGQIADRFLGAKRTILLGGLSIAAGQLLLQVHSTQALLFSLTFIAVGTCLMKPNLSASVGKMYAKDDSRRDAAFTILAPGISVGPVIPLGPRLPTPATPTLRPLPTPTRLPNPQHMHLHIHGCSRPTDPCEGIQRGG